uniref:Complement component C8 beta chain n=1 Tax=Neogobius melanostomus TaxID=47308 RepID=A0A8C6WQM2_9GOBI
IIDRFVLTQTADHAISATKTGHVSVRQAPSSIVVHPVDCAVSEWSQWSRCDVCQKKRVRTITTISPSQFGGEPCHFHDREEEACTVPARYTCNNIPVCEGFLCPQTGRCIPRTLQCNGEDDCGDNSDEAGCRRDIHPCREYAEEYWGIENLAKGINILSSKLEGVVLDNRYYAGSCLPHYIQNDRFRKPYNLQQYTLQAVLLMCTYVFLSKVSPYIHGYLSSELELAQYILKADGLMLHTEFLYRLRSLPQAYVYGEYRQIYRDYGTHYITEAALGGNYEHTIIVDKEKLEKTGDCNHMMKLCVQVGIRVGANIKGIYVTGGLEGGGCDGLLNEMGEDTVNGRMVEDFVAIVKGGSSESITGLVSKKLPDPNLMRLWGQGVRFNPDFIRRTTKPLYEVVTARDFTQSDVLKRNLRRALYEYLAEASPCRCAPCRNNGVAVLKGTRCDCICPTGYSGRGCEITQRPTGIDGSWSCWGSWSSCSGGRMTRSRQCNNPAPSNGGMACRGLPQESTQCF